MCKIFAVRCLSLVLVLGLPGLGGCLGLSFTSTAPNPNVNVSVSNPGRITQYTNSRTIDGSATYTGPAIDLGDGGPNYWHGSGTLMYFNGDKYVGHFWLGDFSGDGTYTYANGSAQKGRWSCGHFWSGDYTQKNSDGSESVWKYEDGRWVSRKGTDISPDGTKCVGVWFSDGRRSEGTITWRDKRSYKGQWRVIEGQMDVPEGNGEMIWPDGRKYVGEFRDGVPHGLGKMTLKNGEVQDGVWANGTFAGRLVK